MKNILYVIPVLLLLLVGCASTGFFGKSSNTIQKQSDKITQIDSSLNGINESKINQIQSLSFGVNNSLNHFTNKPPSEVIVAKELNTRIQTITGLPDDKQQSEMIKLVADLIDKNIQGVKELSDKDKEIQGVENEEQLLIKNKQMEIDKLVEVSKQVALNSDTHKVELNKYTSYWGLGAVAMGIKSFLTHSFWTLLICGTVLIILYILLRVLSFSNPVAALIFGIFQSV